MSHFFSLRFKVKPVMLVRLDLDGNVIHDLQAVADKACPLCRIIGHESHLGNPQVTQNLGSHSIITLIDFKAELQVGFDCIPSGLLKPVCLQFVVRRSGSGPYY